MQANILSNHCNRKMHQRALFALVIAGLIIMTCFRYLGAQADLQNKIRNEVNIVTSNIAASVLFQDKEEIEKIHQSLLFGKEILFSCLYDKNDNLVSIASSAQLPEQLYCGKIKPGHTWIHRYQTQIEYRHNLMGKIEVYYSLADIFSESVIFFAASFFIAIVIWLINVISINHLNIQLASYESQLQDLISRRDSIIQEEHKKIAIEIHDQIGQLLSSANFNIRYLKNRNSKQNRDELLSNTEEILNQVYARIKNISRELHPSVLDFGLQAAIEWLAETRLSPHQIEWRIKRNQGFKKISDHIAIVLFKITQEAFTNILRHSHATAVSIQLHSTHNIIKLVIKDNGIGFSQQAIAKGKSLGLIGISERANALGGQATISADRSGTELTVTLPNQENQHV